MKKITCMIEDGYFVFGIGKYTITIGLRSLFLSYDKNGDIVWYVGRMV